MPPITGWTPGRVFLWGDSAGGHLALLAALTGAAVRAAVGWFPVTDLLGLPSDLAEAGGAPDLGPDSREARLLGAPATAVPDLARQASPVSHAHPGAPPILLQHGTVDDLVPAAQSVRLAEALRQAGAEVELDLVPGATHFWKGASDVPAIIRRSIEFMRARALASFRRAVWGSARSHLVPCAPLTPRIPFVWWIRAWRLISGARAPPNNRKAPINHNNFRMAELVSQGGCVRG